jgi:hypothetical protein
MKTYPIHDSEGKLQAFEITSSWVWFGPLQKLLKSVNGVTEVKRQWFKDDRVVFKYHGHPAVVNEPWGDSSRYWVGLQELEAHKHIDLSPLLEVFNKYRGGTILYIPNREPSNGI